MNLEREVHSVIAAPHNGDSVVAASSASARVMESADMPEPTTAIREDDFGPTTIKNGTVVRASSPIDFVRDFLERAVTRCDCQPHSQPTQTTTLLDLCGSKRL